MNAYDATRFALESCILRGLSAARVRWALVFHGTPSEASKHLGRPFRADDFRLANRRLAAYRRLAARHNLA